jgi:perosamine synthetase
VRAERQPRPAEPLQAAIPLCVPELGGNEARYLQECIASGWVSYLGPFVDRFERDIARAVGADHAIALASGTAALHLALSVAGVGCDDEVLVSSLSFVAPANAVRYVGAHPVFVDAEPRTWQMDVGRIADFLDRDCVHTHEGLVNKASGRRVAALLPVHVLGHPVDMDPLLELARRHGLTVIEDATEALGARYKGRAVGTLGDFACLSFNGNKLLTCGGGGMLLTNRTAAAARARHLSTQAKADRVEYVHDEIGFNYRLTNVQAAVGCAQAERLAEFAAAKRAIARRYAEGLAGCPGVTAMPQAAWADSVFWMYSVRLDAAAYGRDARGLMSALAARGIQTRPLFQPLHLSPAHAGAQPLGGEVAEAIWRDALSLPCSVGLTPRDQDRVIAAVWAVAGET